ncbi:hypothetical protein LINPERPRIM_LOCUS27840 [Linum perenne]
MLHLVLGLPNQGTALGSEEEISLFDFEPISKVQALTNNPLGDCWPSNKLPNMFQLPAHLKVLHFLITRILFPRTTNREVITALDTWILHHAINRAPISFVHLMFNHMVREATDFSRGDLPYAPFITTILLRLGLNFNMRYTEESTVIQFRAQHILHHILWTPVTWAFTSGIDSEEDLDSEEENIPPTHGFPGKPGALIRLLLNMHWIWT